MDRGVRRKLNAAVSARDFCRAHPSADASYTLVLDRLDDRIGRMQGLIRQQHEGFSSKHGSVLHRKELRRTLNDGLLRHLETVAVSADVEAPGLAEQLGRPPANASHAQYGALARGMLELGQQHKELLAKHGLADRALEDLSAALDQFDASVAETNEGRRSHVGARADLKELADECMMIMNLLDGLNRYRFQKDPALRAAWKSARHVVTGPVTAEEKAADASASVPGEVKPAA
jgi:hypothetical protein